MLGLKTGLGLGQSLGVEPSASTVVRNPVVGWGDSLTQGTGASPGADYLTVTGALLDGRANLNRGMGGQGPASIAARQGGVRILLTLETDTIPAHQNLSWDWSFDDLSGGIELLGGDRGASLSLTEGAAVIEAPSWLQGIALPLGRNLPKDTVIDLAIEMTVPPGMVVRVSGFYDSLVSWAAHDGQGNEGRNITASGTYQFSLYVGGFAPGRPSEMNRLVLLTEDAPTGPTSFSISQVSMTTTLGDTAIPASASPTPVAPGLALPGSIDGVAGELLADGSGDLAFRRTDFGASKTVPQSSIFVPEDAQALRRHTQLFWLGNNGIFSNPEAIQAADIVAAMVDHLGHSRFLVLAALPRPDRVAAIGSFNDLLADRFASRFVDVLSALRQAGTASAGDTEDIAAGLVPRSLRSDDIHLNEAGYVIVAQCVSAAMQRRNW